ncbi:50S ribosomal protein L35ae [archaeon]|nr:50S ribosomal protein L35ae [archaeon]|tara:strand:- start:12986 stop:13252 length:267 start_codon:yes stop_codon:yes gene_type:complete
MEAKVINFRRGRHRQHTNQLILDLKGYEDKDKAKGLIGKKVSWTSPGKLKRVINGQVKSTHGNNGNVRAAFEKGLPGQIIGKKIVLED